MKVYRKVHMEGKLGIQADSCILNIIVFKRVNKKVLTGKYTERCTWYKESKLDIQVDSLSLPSVHKRVCMQGSTGKYTDKYNMVWKIKCINIKVYTNIQYTHIKVKYIYMVHITSTHGIHMD